MDEKDEAQKERERQKEMTNTRRIAMGLPPLDAPANRPPTTRIPPVRPPTTQLPVSRPETTSINPKATQRMETPSNPNQSTSTWPGIPYSPGNTRRIVAALEEKSPHKPTSVFAKPLVWLLILLVTPTVIAVGIYVASPGDVVMVDRTTTDFEKNLKPAGAGGSVEEPAIIPPGATPNPKAPRGFTSHKYSTGNIEMKIYRKPGDAVRERAPKKNDVLGAVLPEGGSSIGDDVQSTGEAPAKPKGGPD